MSEGMPPGGAGAGGLQAASRLAHAMRDEVRRVVVGQTEIVDQVIVALFASGHVLLEGVPGLGKTLLVLALARTFGGKFARVQFTPDLMPSDVIGHSIYDAKSQQFTIRQGPAFTQLLLADEINRAPAKTQAALLEVMQEQQITIEGTPLALERPFMTLATQNPIELEGTYPLPEAQLDRFLLKVEIEYPSEEEEHQIVRSITAGSVGDRLDVSAVQTIADPSAVLAAQRAVAQVLADERVTDYAVRIARTTRSWPGFTLGAGPRGAIALIRAARAAAVLDGRDFVTPDDIKQLVGPTLRHRVVVAPDLEMEGRKPDDELRRIVEQVEAPRA